ncbi:MAG: cytochrome B6 [Peptococcaceae bacterium]|nr:cytochrome B6 [Peptococcaceae bacterium]
MNQEQSNYYAGIPMKPFDLIKYTVVSFSAVFVLVIVLAAVFGAPYHPAVTNREVAHKNPRVLQLTAAQDLAGHGEIAKYGPPFNTRGTNGVQTLGPFAPQIWTYKIFGITYPVNAREDFILRPLSMVAHLDPSLAAALARFKAAPPVRKEVWAESYYRALNKVKGDWTAVPRGDYGPVPVMVDSLRRMAASGLLSGAISRTNRVYRYDVGRDLLFLQGKALHQVAGRMDLKGEQWGIMHDEGPYPGPWWLTPYTFLYQVPPWSVSPDGDLMAGVTMTIVFLVLLFWPFIPGLNKLPKYLYIHKIIWRDYYRAVRSGKVAG